MQNLPRHQWDWHKNLILHCVLQLYPACKPPESHYSSLNRISRGVTDWQIKMIWSDLGLKHETWNMKHTFFISHTLSLDNVQSVSHPIQTPQKPPWPLADTLIIQLLIKKKYPSNLSVIRNQSCALKVVGCCQLYVTFAFLRYSWGKRGGEGSLLEWSCFVLGFAAAEISFIQIHSQNSWKQHKNNSQRMNILLFEWGK